MSKSKNDKFELPNLESLIPKPLNPRDLIERSQINVDDLKPIDLAESTGMNSLYEMMFEKQNEMISKQTETVNKLVEMVSYQQKAIDDSNKDSREARVYSIISIVLAIIAIVISIVLG